MVAVNPAGDSPLSRLKAAMAAVAAAALLASAAGIAVAGSFGAQLTGDEPEYILTAISLAEDADLNIADEHASGRYRPFHEARLNAQAKRAAGPRMVSPHDPLLPLLLAIPVRLGGWVGAKVFLTALAAALAAATLWVAVRRFDVSLKTGTMVVGFFAASAPLAVYGNQVYPEVAAALGVLLAVGALTGPLQRKGTVALTAAVIALPWLGIKYGPVAAVLAAVGAIKMIRGSGMRQAMIFAGLLAVAGIFYLFAHQAWYAGWTVYASGEHFAETGEFSVVGSDPNFAARSTRLIGLLIDRKFGLAAWQPAWLLAVGALVVFLRRRPPGWTAVAAPFAAGWLFAAFAAVTMHGWWWPGRHAVVVLPLAVIMLCWWTETRPRVLPVLAVAGAAGAVGHFWIVAEGLAGDISWAVRFFDTTNPVYRGMRPLLPDYMDPSGPNWVLHFVWTAAAAAAAVLTYRVDRGRQKTKGSR